MSTGPTVTLAEAVGRRSEGIVSRCLTGVGEWASPLPHAFEASVMPGVPLPNYPFRRPGPPARRPAPAPRVVTISAAEARRRRTIEAEAKQALALSKATKARVKADMASGADRRGTGRTGRRYGR